MNPVPTVVYPSEEQEKTVRMHRQEDQGSLKWSLRQDGKLSLQEHLNDLHSHGGESRSSAYGRVQNCT